MVQAGGGRRPRIPTVNVSYGRGGGTAGDITPFIEKIEIVEELEGNSDTVSMTVNNYDRRWLSAWRPRLGDYLIVSIGYRNEAFTSPVKYEVDEPTFTFAPDTMAIKGKATPITKSLTQKFSNAFEQWSLPELAQFVADKHGLQLVGQVPEIIFDRVTQKNEPDLAWLRKLALRYGVIFKVESCERLVFYTEKELEAMPPVYTITMNLLSPDGSSSLKLQSTDSYKEAQTDYKEPKTNQWHQVNAQTSNPEIATQDTLRVTGERFETPEQVQLRTEEALRKANSTVVEGTLNVEGEVYYRAGLNIALPTDPMQFGDMGGKFQIRRVRHNLVPEGGVKQGWRSELEVRKVFDGSGVGGISFGGGGISFGGITIGF